MDVMNPVLAQKMGLTATAEATGDEAGAVSPIRIMRRAMARAADKAVGMSASVLGMSDEEASAEELIENAPDDWVVLGLRDGSEAGLTGLFLIDPPLRSALVEMQTMGALLAAPAVQRSVTGTDAALSLPFATKLLSELEEAGFDVGDVAAGQYDIGPIEDIRTAGLVLCQGRFRYWRVSLQMGGADLQGELMIATRCALATEDTPTEGANEWSSTFQKTVEGVTAEMDAVLAQVKMPISEVEALAVGQILRLAGTTVGSVTLSSPDGKAIAKARLGQVAGKRAVRIETPNVELQDAVPIQTIEGKVSGVKTDALVGG